MAPIYDSGSSLGYDKVAAEIRRDLNTPCKPFKNHHEEQLKLVTDFSWIDFSRLSGIREWIIETLSSDSAAEYIGESRIRRIAETVQNRIVRVRELSVTRRTVRADTTRDDVERNTSATYSSQMNR